MIRLIRLILIVVNPYLQQIKNNSSLTGTIITNVENEIKRLDKGSTTKLIAGNVAKK